MNDTKGYYQKYNVERKDGKEIKGRTFTLELDTDQHAPAAMRAYMESLRRENPSKFEDLIQWIDGYLAAIEE